jgi:hypothetical protein
MERHVIDRPREAETGRLSRYLAHERIQRLRGPHQAITLLRRLPRGASGASQRLKSYLRIEASPRDETPAP